MRLRNVQGAREAMIESEYTVNEPVEMKGKWNELFHNCNPIHLEIGARCFYGTAKRLARRTGTNSELSRKVRSRREILAQKPSCPAKFD